MNSPQDKITLLVRDPRWIYAYWEITPQAFDKGKITLRVYDVSNARAFFDVLINESANNWYIETDGPGKSFCVDIGYSLPEGRFIAVACSNTVRMPAEGPSAVGDGECMVSEEKSGQH